MPITGSLATYCCPILLPQNLGCSVVGRDCSRRWVVWLTLRDFATQRVPCRCAARSACGVTMRYQVVFSLGNSAKSWLPHERQWCKPCHPTLSKPRGCTAPTLQPTFISLEAHMRGSQGTSCQQHLLRRLAESSPLLFGLISYDHERSSSAGASHKQPERTAP